MTTKAKEQDGKEQAAGKLPVKPRRVKRQEPPPVTADEVAAPVEQPSERVFPIVGIGASAGGLEAFDKFFTHMPPDSDMAFVLVQHLDPTHESILVDLIRRYTRMEVFQVQDGMKIRPNCIYVIPPNRDMAILHGTLHLMEPSARRGLRLPIDFFFRSLSEDQGERAIGIVLSGTGSDGTLGLKAIKGEGGMAMVQDPLSAKYDGMPRSAISTGMMDFILSPEAMAEQLISYVKHAFVSRIKKPEPLLPQSASSLQKIFILLRNHTGYDFSLYKNTTIGRRIERRMNVNQIDYIGDYVRYLQQNPTEVETLFRELLIGVTRFFRDQEAFTALEQKVVPRLFYNRPPSEPIRVWVPGCATGEEAFSIAILLREHMERLSQSFEVQIFATDIDDHAIEKARNAVYPDGIAADITPERLGRFFVKEGSSYQVSKPIRDLVIFAVQSVIKDPPFSRIDLISCRNLLIYLGQELQKQVFQLFFYSLKPGGFLFLGNSETLGTAVDSHTIIDSRWRIFQRTTNTSGLRNTLDMLPPPLIRQRLDPDAKSDQTLGMRELTEKILLEEYAPPCVIIDERGDVLYFHGRTGKFLEPASGKASFNVLRMAREGLRMPLTAAIRKAINQKQDVIYERLEIQANDEIETVKLTVKPILKPISMRGLVLIIFEEAGSPPWQKPEQVTDDRPDEQDRYVVALRQELKSTKEYLQTTVEELETSNEDLRFANEAMQSTNEELQSTNEELETSQEELQSVNEELVTVNSELQLKIDELTKANNDIDNLLNNTRIGTIFLDRNLQIERFTPTATQIINLIDSDVGRPLSHIASNLKVGDLIGKANQVLDTLTPQEAEVQTRKGSWYWMQIMPYRTIENIVDGVVLTFTDITEQKRLQAEIEQRLQAEQTLRQSEQFLQAVLNALPVQLAILDDTGKILAVNALWHDFARQNSLSWPDYGVGSNYLAVCEVAEGDRSGEARAAAEGIRQVIEQKLDRFYLEYPCHSPTEERWFKMIVTRFDHEGNVRVVVAHENITDRVQAELKLKKSS
ncbi:MAG TPA: chemotaxis protein CheB [Anaerolineae bacterium]|nr:chemotaxis protein CheB [Anaerolineae bacterium]HMR63618.1 chemotaxis protein CheB [Anaerolineae bacterium]